MTLGDVRAWALAFVLTQCLELPIYLLFLRRTPRPLREKLAIAFAASGLTHPFAWFAAPALLGPRMYLPGVEAAVFVVEAAWLSSFGVPRPVLASAVANATSCLAGLALLRAFA